MAKPLPIQAEATATGNAEDEEADYDQTVSQITVLDHNPKTQGEFTPPPIEDARQEITPRPKFERLKKQFYRAIEVLSEHDAEYLSFEYNFQTKYLKVTLSQIEPAMIQ